ncbi:uncharacterized protein LOC106640293 [Copidosoma floridanum]|uniref:uncharacterized protein LOC106640293 n=1 Tax=Copidosoma floridanum TaxID=29053 RepID=UPI0006C956C7|nr:uncharacterized protein LOC106640293 [Copidosoma floridanum]
MSMGHGGHGGGHGGMSSGRASMGLGGGAQDGVSSSGGSSGMSMGHSGNSYRWSSNQGGGHGSMSSGGASTDLGKSDTARMEVEDVHVTHVNGRYFDRESLDVSVNRRPYGRNTINSRVRVIEDLPRDMSLKTDVYAHVFGNTYAPTGVSYDTPVCMDASNNRVFQQVMNRMGVNCGCPPKRGMYESLEMEPNIRVPPCATNLPRMMLNNELYSRSGTLMKTRTFVNFVPPENMRYSRQYQKFNRPCTQCNRCRSWNFN